jgi:pseudaminic acid biosynthesis-associated methylase
MQTFKSRQEEFWAGEFGDEYIQRNSSAQLLASNIHFFSTIFAVTEPIKSVLEMGANVGMNLKAIRHLLPHASLAGVEINKKAYETLIANNDIDGYHSSILDFKVDQQREFVLIKGVLIHINPDNLQDVYQKLYDASANYICIAEYYNPVPVELSYRGHEGKLFKRDFAGEFMQKFPDVKLVKYGFAYHKDVLFPQDDINWFLLKKPTTN